MRARPSIVVLAAVISVAVAGCAHTRGLPVATSWLGLLAVGLILLVVALCTAIIVLVRRINRKTAHSEDLDANPLLPGEARWVVGRDGMVLDSCTNRDEHGISPGWAVGHPIWTWATPGSVSEPHYRGALDDRRAAVYDDTFKGPNGAAKHVRVALAPRSDGSVYCESWDVTAYVEACAAAERRAEEAEGRVSFLMSHTTAQALTLGNEVPAEATSTPPAGDDAQEGAPA